MELSQLLHFKEVAKYENMTLAAKECHVSQQALSKSIKKLEKELGVQLFNRENNHLTLNDSGKIALEQIESILAKIDTLPAAVQHPAPSKELIIGSSSLISIRSLILNFNNIHPNFRLTTKSLSEDMLIRKLLHHQVDVAISYQQYHIEQIHSVPLFQETLMLAVPENSTFSNKKKISFKDLTNQNILRLNTSELQLDHILDELCRINHIKINFFWQNDSMIWDGLCLNPQYLFLTSSLHLDFLPPGRIAIPFEDPQLTILLYLHFLDSNENAQQFYLWIKNFYS